MKLFYCCFVLFALLSSVSFSQKNDLDDFHLSGKVKSMIWATECTNRSKTKENKCRDSYMTVRFDKQGYKIVSYSQNFGHDSAARVFNGKGQIIRLEEYRGKDTDIAQYAYNDEGALIEETLTYTNALQGEKKQIIKYNKRGWETSEEHEYADSTKNKVYEFIYKYDSKDSIVEMKKMDLRTYRSLITEYSYDEWGYIKEETYSDDNGEIITRSVYKNDAKGNHLEITWENNSRTGHSLVNEILKYDEHNNCIEYTYDNKEKGLKGKVTNKYKYDAKGNWTKETRVKDGKTEAISTRTLEYY